MSAVPTVPHWVNGQSLVGTGDRVTDVHDPATGVLVGHVVEATAAEVDVAVAAAATAFEAWSRVSVARRAQVMFRFRDLLVAHTDELAAIITREHGKVLADARGEIARGLEVVEFACGAPQLLKGEFSQEAASGIDVYSFRQPVGVVAGITPFNFPAMIPLWMSPLALACGNTFVLKPPSRDPSAAMLLARLWAQAGLPAGAFEVVHGDEGAVTALLTHPQVAAVSFVGSTTTAKIVHATATAHGKRVQALGGAKNHAVVLADADLEQAAESIVAAAFGAAGERCMALPVVLVQQEVHDELAALLVAKASAIRVRPGTDADSDLGPVISQAARDRIVGLVDGAQAEGARVLLDGRDTVVPGHEAGWFLGPTVLDAVTPDMAIQHVEVFGPVLELVTVADLDAGIAAIQASPYGNGAAIFTSSGQAARTFAQAPRTAGMIGVNVAIPVPVAWHSFGGWKDSLIGEAHMYGPEGVEFFTRARVVTQRWPRGTAPASFHFSGDATT